MAFVGSRNNSGSHQPKSRGWVRDARRQQRAICGAMRSAALLLLGDKLLHLDRVAL
jgi:hypothetical protein